jgi:hypothetical protein
VDILRFPFQDLANFPRLSFFQGEDAGKTKCFQASFVHCRRAVGLIAAAVAALQNHDVADAARQLDDAPEALRGWEWRHLSSRLDDSSAVVRLRPGDPAVLFSGPEGLRVGIITGGTRAWWPGSWRSSRRSWWGR